MVNRANPDRSLKKNMGGVLLKLKYTLGDLFIVPHLAGATANPFKKARGTDLDPGDTPTIRDAVDKLATGESWA